MRAFDLDGVIAIQPPPSEKKWGKMNGMERNQRKQDVISHYITAGVLEKPEGEFIIITARKLEDEVVAATTHWLNKHDIHPTHIAFLNTSRTIENVVRYKSTVLKNSGATDFYEDNLKVLKGMIKTYPDCRYHHYKNGIFTLIHEGESK